MCTCWWWRWWCPLPEKGYPQCKCCLLLFLPQKRVFFFWLVCSSCCCASCHRHHLLVLCVCMLSCLVVSCVDRLSLTLYLPKLMLTFTQTEREREAQLKQTHFTCVFTPRWPSFRWRSLSLALSFALTFASDALLDEDDDSKTHTTHIFHWHWEWGFLLLSSRERLRTYAHTHTHSGALETADNQLALSLQVLLLLRFLPKGTLRDLIMHPHQQQQSISPFH